MSAWFCMFLPFSLLKSHFLCFNALINLVYNNILSWIKLHFHCALHTCWQYLMCLCVCVILCVRVCIFDFQSLRPVVDVDELRPAVQTLKDSLANSHASPWQNEETRVRYKLIIDTSPDEAILQLFLTQRRQFSESRVECVMCSPFARDIFTSKVVTFWGFWHISVHWSGGPGLNVNLLCVWMDNVQWCVSYPLAEITFSVHSSC